MEISGGWGALFYCFGLEASVFYHPYGMCWHVLIDGEWWLRRDIGNIDIVVLAILAMNGIGGNDEPEEAQVEGHLQHVQ